MATSTTNPHVLHPGRKVFIPLENNPDVMNPLAHRLGLSPSLKFHDVYSLTEPDLLAILPRPCYALLFVFPVTPISEHFWQAEDAVRVPYEGKGSAEPSLWFRQTIGHACGLIGLLHCITNIKDTHGVVPGSDLEKLIQQAEPLDPTARAQLLYDSELLEAAHGEAAHRGSSIVPTPQEDPGCGYIAFVKGKDGHLWELEGRRSGPLDRGKINDSEDLLDPSVIARGPGQWLAREKNSGGDCRFSCLALGAAA